MAKFKTEYLINEYKILPARKVSSRILFSLQNVCLKFLRPLPKKLEIATFSNFYLKLEFFRKLSNLE